MDAGARGRILRAPVRVMTATLPAGGTLRSPNGERVTVSGCGAGSWDITNDRPSGACTTSSSTPIAPPFLDETTLVDCNGRRGFAQGNPLPQSCGAFLPVGPNAVTTPAKPLRCDASRHPGTQRGSYRIDDRHGWITAVNPGKGAPDRIFLAHVRLSLGQPVAGREGWSPGGAWIVWEHRTAPAVSDPHPGGRTGTVQ